MDALVGLKRKARQRGAPDPEVRAKAKRRKYTAAEKLSIVERAEAAKEEGGIGALLRREGLYSSQLSE